eukprot:CAMPEP_0205830212 /NCGR_PEP_ID=MMETSP0206-20130828/40408_1 /ASSEMBLY_ACC=CAM_ASM_000279 /TAXON_ID=36767 /ORGANISM="Euplotes focardii, Strain TN1" /LENGTH=54 /DNA_ID=CAMNT_0053133647 /DNA_START=72 /DNA_END=236 /DNA_ORIENTATION=-
MLDNDIKYLLIGLFKMCINFHIIQIAHFDDIVISDFLDHTKVFNYVTHNNDIAS